MSTWVVAGRRTGEWSTCYLESIPERNVLHGTMGDYGYGISLEGALRFEKESTARWHAARWYGTDAAVSEIRHKSFELAERGSRTRATEALTASLGECRRCYRVSADPVCEGVCNLCYATCGGFCSCGGLTSGVGACIRCGSRHRARFDVRGACVRCRVSGAPCAECVADTRCAADWLPGNARCDNPANMVYDGTPCCDECWHEAQELARDD